ncbi:MAG: Ltp family lipoprotein [Micromonosporaceae bacterium]|nr:Ltp family lipoprotein [Micromonosporaceae bacterium]
MSTGTHGMSPAGWYPDPRHAGVERYFDGTVWTAHVRPTAPSQQHTASMPLSATAHAQPVPVTVPIAPASAAAPVTAPIPTVVGDPVRHAPSGTSPKSFLTTWALSLLLGVFGADRFYLGKTGTGVLKLVTFGGFGVWWLTDLVITLTGNATDRRGSRVRGTEREPAVAWALTGAFILVSLVINAVSPDSTGPREALLARPAASTAPPSTPAPSEQAASPSTPDPSQTTPAHQTSTGGGGTGNGGGGGGQQGGGGTGPSGATVSQQQAIAAARSYLNVLPFSRSGLIDQLEFEGFSTADATFAVDQLDVDWKEQAVRMARNYLDVQAFSRSGLIHQLEFEGFSTAEATYGVDQLGVDWKEQAARMARTYLEIFSFSRAELLSQLEFEGFTRAEAEYGVASVGL